jgi:Ca2+-binding EF-hand superfamily protein
MAGRFPPLPALTQAEAKQFKAEFLACAVEKKGSLTRREFQKALRHLGYEPTVDQINEMLRDLGTEEVNLPNFILMIHYYRRALDTSHELERALAIFDDDHNGALSCRVVSEALKMMRSKIEPARIEAIIQKLGGSGEITIADLVRELRPS